MHGMDTHDEIVYWRERCLAAERERDELRALAYRRLALQVDLESKLAALTAARGDQALIK